MKPIVIGIVTGLIAFVPLLILNGIESALVGGFIAGFFSFEIAFYYIKNKELKKDEPYYEFKKYTPYLLKKK